MEIQTERGFVISIEIGRAGLVTVQLLLADGSIGTFIIADLDGDPERFNERLSKLALLRDALDRAEPVEIEHSGGDGGRAIERVRRITRDSLASARGEIRVVVGYVLDLSLHAENRDAGNGEAADMAEIELLSDQLAMETLQLDMQIPERGVAGQQLTMLREAQAGGHPVRLLVVGGQTPGSDTGATGRVGGRIINTAVLYNADSFGDDRGQDISGFVESLSLIQIMGGSTGAFAHVRLTTAPDFNGPGGSVGLSIFDPVTWNLFVPKGSLAYDLFEAGLRDNLRMRVRALTAGRDDPKATGASSPTAVPDRGANVEEVTVTGTSGSPASEVGGGAREAMLGNLRSRAVGSAVKEGEPVGLAYGAELLAHLASASRPVWVMITRGTLDIGPGAPGCNSGVPSSDLKVRTLRDLRIPYPAVWTGIGCFNPGVYRFQLCLPGEYMLFVDNEELCLHDAEEEGYQLAHACLGGEHEVRVELAAWTCDDEFVMDVYQLR